MSAYSEQTTEFKDADLLIEALKDIGIREIHHYEHPIHLEGYLGDKRNEVAEIVIPRRSVGIAANDIGFKKQANGNYTAIISEFDSRNYDQKWMQKLKCIYAEKGIMRQASRAGLRFAGKKNVNGKVQLQFVKI